MLRWTQQVAGIAKPVLEDHGRLPYLEGAWIPNVQDSLIAIHAKIVLIKSWVMKPKWEEDMMIMDIFCTDNSLTNTQLQVLNCCRMFLCVELLPDISTSDGESMIPKVFTQQKGEKLNNLCLVKR
eukprot:10515357-Ditylum_brightwellii.AAC.1